MYVSPILAAEIEKKFVTVFSEHSMEKLLLFPPFISNDTTLEFRQLASSVSRTSSLQTFYFCHFTFCISTVNASDWNSEWLYLRSQQAIKVNRKEKGSCFYSGNQRKYSHSISVYTKDDHILTKERKFSLLSLYTEGGESPVHFPISGSCD